MSERLVRGQRVPAFFYGTAWKEERTRGLVREALQAGFRAIDSANQRKHYHEAEVGEALREAFAAGELRREDLFIQTKFTHRGGQDHRLPYDPRAPVSAQVVSSCEGSLAQLGVDSIDSFLLHGPSQREGLGAADLEAWRAMLGLRAAGKVRLLGVSNVSRAQLAVLCERSGEPPAFVQNRCYARTGWDREVRRLCTERDITYQAFSLLTANARELARPAVLHLARRLGLTPEQLAFRFAVHRGMIPLTGTSSPRHMREDLAALSVPLDEADAATLDDLGG